MKEFINKKDERPERPTNPSSQPKPGTKNVPYSPGRPDRTIKGPERRTR